ncbi:MAG: FAD-binding protein [Bacteroidales bacterium]|nr:FAD-binding protein [Bacteroidales bacterium]
MKRLDIDLTPEQYHIESERRLAVARRLGVAPNEVGPIVVTRRSLDSRRGTVRYHAQLEVYAPTEPMAAANYASPYRQCHNGEPVVVVGAGPAGLFAALRMLELGLKPIIVERGKAVGDRKYDIARLTRDRVVDPDSNWCFGEGGAGTYSDGKLYTRSTKRGDVGNVLRKFIEHGADPEILIDAHAHIGTDRLSGIIGRMRQTVTDCGGEYHFGHRVADLIVDSDNNVKGVACTDGTRFEGRAVVLATGHSARDIYRLFAHRGWELQAKPFALGVRVEHPQELINQLQYHSQKLSPLLPPAAYSLVTQVDGHGVFSFCMCPGGVIVPAATAAGEQVVNGMSNSRRNSPFANSGIAVSVGLADVPAYADRGPLALLEFQEEVEQAMFAAAGEPITAPAQGLVDFCNGRESQRLNASGYMATLAPRPLHRLLPPFVAEALQQGFRDFDRKMHGFLTAEATIMAVESRTSSPVRIPRLPDGQHTQLRNLYPCGEGAGYAGGIVSSAMDGIKVAEQIYATLNH